MVGSFSPSTELWAGFLDGGQTMGGFHSSLAVLLSARARSCLTCCVCHSAELLRELGLRTGIGEGPKGPPLLPPSSMRCSSEA